MALVAAYDKTTGEKQPPVPEHWFDNPVLSQNLRKTPKQTAAESTTKAPSGDDKKEK